MIDRPRTAFLLNSALVCAVLLSFYWLVPTPQDGDSICFIPQIYEYSHDHSLVNPFFNAILAVREHSEGMALWNGGKVTWHGVFMPLAVGSVFRNASYSEIMHAIGLFGVFVVSAWTVLCLPKVKSDWVVALVCCLMTWALAGWFCGATGRNEWFCMVVVCAALLLTHRINRTALKVAVFGFSAGLCFITSPQTGIVGMLLLSCYACFTGDTTRGILGSIALAGVASAIAIAVGLTLYPFTAGEWLSGMREHANAAFVHRTDFTLSRTLVAQFFRPYQPMFVPWLAIGLVGLAFAGFCRRSCTKSVYWLYAFAASATAVYVVYACRGLLIYNALPFLPLAMLACLWVARASSRPMRRWILLCFAGSVSIISATPLIAQVFVPTIMGADTYAQAKSVIGDLKERYGSITISTGLFLALPDNINVDVQPFSKIHSKEFRGNGRVLIVQQVFPYKSSPPAYSCYRLMWSRFVNRPLTIGGLTIAKSPGGWNLAVYERIDPK